MVHLILLITGHYGFIPTKAVIGRILLISCQIQPTFCSSGVSTFLYFKWLVCDSLNSLWCHSYGSWMWLLCGLHDISATWMRFKVSLMGSAHVLKNFCFHLLSPILYLCLMLWMSVLATSTLSTKLFILCFDSVRY